MINYSMSQSDKTQKQIKHNKLTNAFKSIPTMLFKICEQPGMNIFNRSLNNYNRKTSH